MNREVSRPWGRSEAVIISGTILVPRVGLVKKANPVPRCSLK